MTTKVESQYIHNSKLYYFETDDNEVKVLDNNNNEIGTLRELAFNGKTIVGGNFKDIKHTGLYKIKGVSGLPSNIPNDQECMLSVQSIGPNLLLYRLISPNGVIVENTISGSNQSGWGSGGTDLRNTIKNINSAIGDLSKLKTSSKNMADAINEVSDRLGNLQNDTKRRLGNLESKNFDTRYLMQAGGDMNGNIAMKNGYAYKVKNNKDQPVDFGYMDSGNHINIGSNDYQLNLKGAGNMTYNGSKVFTEANTGKGSNLDADKLDGIDSSGFIKTWEDDTKHSRLTMDQRNVHFNIKDNENSETGLVFDKNNKWTSKVVGTEIGDVHIQTGGKEYKQPPFTFNQDRNFVQYGGGHFIRSSEPALYFQVYDEEHDSSDNGISFWRPNWDSGSLAVGNWNTSEVVAQFAVGANHEAVKLTNSPYIGNHNRRLFLQDEEPSGDKPYGSIWIGF